MKQLDETIFDEVGLSALTPEQKERMLAYVYTTLRTRVGVALATDANQEQLQAINSLTDETDEEKVYAALEEVFPNFDEIYEKELAELKDDLADMAPEVLSAE